jgi:hypothetical protein
VNSKCQAAFFVKALCSNHSTLALKKPHAEHGCAESHEAAMEAVAKAGGKTRPVNGDRLTRRLGVWLRANVLQNLFAERIRAALATLG